MKRKLSSSKVDEEETRLASILFNKPKDFAAKLISEATEDFIDVDLKPAWMDEDDDEFDAKIIPNATSKGLYKDVLKQKYELLMGTPNWARLGRKVGNNDEDEEILRTVGHIQKTRNDRVPKDFLEIKQFPKIYTETVKQTVTCLEFHPTASVALVGTHLGKILLYSIGGDVHNQLHSFQLSKFKPTNAFFTPDGTEAYISAKSSKDYCVYNLVKAEPKLYRLPQIIQKTSLLVMSPNGKYLLVSSGFDEVYIISTASKELLKSLKHNNDVVSLALSNDNEKLYTFCKEGQVCIWNLSTYRVEKKFYDHGCVTSSCIATSPCGRLLATGSGEGIVNIYEISSLDSAEPTPVKVIQNLKTKITHLNFNSTSEILSITSAFYPNAVKLVHIPSYHIFANFPPPGFNLFQVEKITFSPNSGYMALGNNKGSAFLYRLKHYKNY